MDYYWDSYYYGGTLDDKATDEKMFQCPYDAATKCLMVDGCRGCEEWARFIKKHGENHNLIAR